MFARLGSVVVRHPWRTILAWVGATLAIALSAPVLAATSDQADFLPRGYESVRAQELATTSFPDVESPAALMVFTAQGGGALTVSDQGMVAQVVQTLDAKGYPDVAAVQTDRSRVSPNRDVMLGIVLPTSGTSEVLVGAALAESIRTLRVDAQLLLAESDLQLGVTGDVAQRIDTEDASGDVDQLVLLGTLALIVILMLMIFRSIVLAVLPVLTILLVALGSSGLIGFASELFGLQADQSIQSLLIVVLFGVGSDYFLFLVFRYRENLRAGVEPKQAMVRAVARVGEAITSAAAVVIVAFMALVLSTLGQLRAYGPALAIAVAVTLVAALTLVPAIISLLGTKVFWPSRSYGRPARQRGSRAAGELVRRFPAMVAAAAALVMATLAVYALGFTPQFDQTASGPQGLESVIAQQDLERGFSAGQTQPTDVIVASTDGSGLQEQELAALSDSLKSVPGVGDVESVTLNEAGDAALLSVVLEAVPTSDAAIALAGGALRNTAHGEAPAGSVAYVGGLSSVLADIQTAINHDYRVVFPVASVAILLILALLLRSVVAPWYLMASVALGFVASLGATVLVFQELRNQEGLLFTLPILMYLFVVAIGTDYNIIMVARIREETRTGSTTRAAASVAVRHTASTIAAGGVILGGTFAVLTAANDPSLQQLGVGISVGIAVSAFVMAIFLTPALTALLGRRAFWPGNGPPVEESPDTSAWPSPSPVVDAVEVVR